MKHFKNIFLKYNLIFYIVIFLISLAIISPIIANYMLGHDSAFHISNVQAIKMAIRTNNWFFPKILPVIANNFGYATPLFYGPLPHSITVFISEIIGLVRNISILHVMSFVHFLTLCFSGIFMFQYSRKITKNNYISLLSSVIYITFPYHLSEIFVRDAYAESITFVFIPLIFNGLYELFYNKNNKKFYLHFIIGVCGLILSHTITTLFTAIIVLIYLLINYKKTFTRDIMKSLCISLMFILSITSFYLFPLLEQKLMGNYHVFNANSMATNDSIINQALTPRLLLPFANSKSADGIQFFIFIPVICLFIYSIFAFPKVKTNQKGLYLFFIITGCILLFMTTRMFPWKIMPSLLKYIQFPWRLLVFISFFISASCTLCLKLYNDTLIKILSIVFIALILGSSINSVNLERITNYTPDNIDISTFGIGATNEYFPESVIKNFDYYKNRNDEIKVISGDQNAVINVIAKDTPYIKFNVECSEYTIFELPLLYYYGYGANIQRTIYLENANSNYNSSNLIKEGYNGFINIRIPKGNYTVIVDYNGTKLQHMCNMISILSLIIFGIYSMKRSQENEKR